MISISISISSCGAQQSRTHSHAHSLRFTTVKCSRTHQALINLNMVKNGSESSASEQLIVKIIVRSPSWCSQGSVSRIKDHLDMASHGSSQKGQCQRAHSTLRTQIIIPPSLHHLSKSDSTHHLIWVSSFHSLSGILGSPLLSLSSSRFISIFDTFSLEKRGEQIHQKIQGKIHIGIWEFRGRF